MNEFIGDVVVSQFNQLLFMKYKNFKCEIQVNSYKTINLTWFNYIPPRKQA